MEDTLEADNSELPMDTKLEVIGNVEMFDNAWTEARMWIIQAEQALQSVQSVDTTKSFERLTDFVKNISDVVLKEVKNAAEQCIDFANALVKKPKEDSTVEETENLESQNEMELDKAAVDTDCFREDLDIKKQFSILEKAAQYTKGAKPPKSAKKSQSKTPKKDSKSARTTRGTSAASSDQDSNSEFSCDICKIDCETKSNRKNHIAEIHMIEQGEPIRCKKCSSEFPGTQEFIDHVRKNHREVNRNECGACGTLTKDIRDHMRRVHWKRYKCTECGKCLARFGELVIHHRIHTKERPYHCDECDLTFRKLQTLMEHKYTHDTSQGVSCDLCHKMFRTETKLKLHIKHIHDNEKPHSCDVCGVGFTMRCRLRDHMFMHTGTSAHQCPICKKYFKERKNLRLHIRNIHQKPRKAAAVDKNEIKPQPIQCAHCFFEFDDKFEFLKHMSSEHPEIPSNQCGACGKVVKDIAYHMSRVHSKRFKCDICGMLKSRKSDLEAHKLTHTDEKPFICEICGKAFYSLDGCREHRKTHESSRYPCEICNKTFANGNSLSKHINRIHRGIKPAVCEVCGKAYESQAGLKRHKFIHTGVSNHYCSLCKKYFESFTQLRKHNDIRHKGLANKYKYRCPICAKYISRSSKKYHLLSHKGERTLSCKDCGKTFVWPSALRDHRKTHLAEKN